MTRDADEARAAVGGDADLRESREDVSRREAFAPDGGGGGVLVCHGFTGSPPGGRAPAQGFARLPARPALRVRIFQAKG